MPNAPQFLVTQFGIWKAGAIAVPLNPFYTDQELAHALNEVGATLVVVLTLFYDKIKALQPQTAVKQVVATHIKEYLPSFKRLLFTLLRDRKEGHRIQLAAGDEWLPTLLRAGQGIRHTSLATPDRPALLMFTGGTTGNPKAAVSTHHGLTMAGRQISAWMKNVTEPWQDAILLLMPLFHTYGNVGVLSAALVSRLTMVPIPNPRDLDGLVAIVDKERPAFLAGVPTLFNALLNHPRVRDGGVNMRSIKLCLSGASALLAETKLRFESVSGGRIIEGYALTESVMALVMTPVAGTYKPGSVGLPLPDVAVRVVDVDDTTVDLPLGEVGEILIGAPQLMAGYWRRPAETEEILRDGWLHTGDLGYLDEDHYLFVVDRKKDVIKPSGFQVWPREVEEVLATHPAVAEVGVAGVPDPLQVEAVKAWVVVRAGEQVTEAALRDHCRATLAAYKVPRQIVFRSALPKSTVGKVLRRRLVAEDLAAEEEEAPQS